MIEDINGKHISYTYGLHPKFILYDLYKKYQLLVDERIRIGEDLACTIPCIFAMNTFYLMPECLYYWRQHVGSVSKSKSNFNFYDLLSPLLLCQHFERYLDMNVGDLQEQVYRCAVRRLFSACIAQFNREASWKEITDMISEALDEPYYKKALESCKYKNYWQGELALYALKKRRFFLMWLYNHYLLWSLHQSYSTIGLHVR